MSHYVISVLYIWMYGRYRGLNQNSINILTDLRKKPARADMVEQQVWKRIS